MKVLASDFDNTLFFRDSQVFFEGYIKDEDKEAIKRFQRKGNLFGICSGRPLVGITRDVKDIQLDFYIVSSGAAIFDKDLKVIYENRINMDLVKKVIKKYGDDKSYSLADENDFCSINGEKHFHNRLPNYNNVDDIDKEYVVHFSIHFDNEKICHEYALKLEKDFPMLEGYQNIESLDIVAKGCSKGQGIKIMEEYLKVNSKDFSCIGDNYNDIPMLEISDNSYTFNGSPQGVKDIADKYVDSIAECISDIID
ncbi:MAG: HAD-IIB family hydrolase [Thomasclavelia sp.]|nr:HAD-IIB family hydrolase [Thomasclavelia sp.]